MSKFIIIVSLVLFCFPGITSVSARYASLVVDVNSGNELHARNANIRKFPASLTKIMTLYLVFDALEKGKLHLNSRLKVSRRASKQPRIRLGLKTGETISVRDAILALITRSANDVATVIAENMAGTEFRFASRMTQKARKLGMNRTSFRNASGLPNRRQLSTARDMAKLAIAIRADFPQYYHYFRTKKFRFKGRSYRNHNMLLGRYVGTDGIKTGYTNASGYNLVASVKRQGRHLIGVVFGGRTSMRRDRHMVRLLNRGFTKVKKIKQIVHLPPLPQSRPVNIGNVKRESNKGANDSAKLWIPKSKNWGIQVGAYSNPRPARSIIHTARKHLGLLAATQFDKIERLHRRHGVIYRARVLGFAETEAKNACFILIAKHLPCVPVSIDVDLAEATRR